MNVQGVLLIRNQRYPLDVISIKIVTAIHRYVLIKKGHSFQFLYNQETVTSLDASNTEPIIITGRYEPGKIAARPTIE
jgi:hypothetical protein